MLTISALFVGPLALQSGCSTSPPTRADGLPIVPRYTNAIQLDWMLSGYSQSVERAVQSGQLPSLLEDACLGWERAIFDLESGRRYPAWLRMSTENANLTNLLERYPEIIRRHPRPAACESVDSPPPPVEIPASTASSTTPDSSPATASATDQTQTADQAENQPSDQAASAAQAAQAASAAPDSVVAAPPVMTVSPPPRHATAVANERVLLDRLRIAVGISADPSTTDSATNAPVDLAVLKELAQSDLPTIRLRARYHLLGQCVLATERGDRDFLVGGSPIGENTVCVDRQPKESLRLVQKRLSRSMLDAWRGRTYEPFSDLAVALASFALRDNPNLDGPRIAR